MATKPAEKTTLEIKRFINAPRDRVYAAWTDPTQLKEWWGPKQMRTKTLEFDPREGGNYRWTLVNEEGEEMTVSGAYRELVPAKKIVFSWKWEDDEAWENHSSMVTVELSDRDGGTELRLTHEQLPSVESRERHTEGWGVVLDRLEKFVGK